MGENHNQLCESHFRLISMLLILTVLSIHASSVCPCLETLPFVNYTWHDSGKYTNIHKIDNITSGLHNVSFLL
jgi:hypothetical protein